METNNLEFRKIDAENLTIEVFNASENSFGVASVIISGKSDAVLIDAQFTLAEAEIVAKHIEESGKNLKMIYVSHNDPDFYFGLEVFKRYFPKVTAYASPKVVEAIAKTSQKKLDVWGEKLGNAITSNIVLPQIIKNNKIELEDKTLEIVGLEEFPERTFVWIPSAKAVVGGINIFGNHFNLWMADAQTTESRAKWIEIIDRIIALNPSIIVPAHGKLNDDLDVKSAIHTKEYIQFYEESLKTDTNSQQLVQAIKSKYPDLTFEIALQIGAKVNTGEMNW